MNYTELKDNILQICEDDFTDAELAMFTQQAEQKIYNSVQLDILRKTGSVTLTIGNQYADLPTDFLAPYEFAVISANSNYSFLLNKDVNFIREAYPSANVTGTPKYYALFGFKSGSNTATRVLLGPTPDAALTTELNYFYYPESIVDAGATWLGENFDSALLNGALMEAIRYQKGEADMIAMYEKLYVQSIALLKGLGDGKQRRDTYRSGQNRAEVK